MSFPVPKFYQYNMPTKGPAESMMEGLESGMNNMQRLKESDERIKMYQERIKTSDVNRQRIKQQMDQSNQSFPLTMKQLEANIEKIQGENSLIPYHKQLLIAQQYQAMAAAHASERGGDGINRPKSEIGKVLADANNASDPTQKQIILDYAKNFSDIEKNKTISPGDVAIQKKDAVDFGVAASSAANDAKMAHDYLNSLKGFSNAYDKVPIWMKGSMYSPKHTSTIANYTGYGGPVGEAEKYKSDLTMRQASILHGARATQTVLGIAGKSMPGLDLTPEAVHALTPALAISAQQTIEKPKFYAELQKRGIHSQVQADALWENIAEKYPVLDENHIPHPENLTVWKKFINNISDSSNIQNMDIESNDEPTEQPKIVRMVDSKGQEWDVPANKVPEALDNNMKVKEGN